MDIEMIESDFRDKVCEKLRISTGAKHIPPGYTLFPRGHPMGKGVREYKGGSRFALIYMN